MKQPTLKSQIRSFLREKNGNWIHKGQIVKITWKNQKNGTTYLADNVGVVLRKLERDRIIAVRDDIHHKSIEYRFLQEYERDRYIPTSYRLPGEHNKIFKS